MFAKLLVIAGPDRGKRFEMIEKLPLVVGRSRESDAAVSDPRVSPLHCKLTVRGGTLFVTDMDSLTGTSVNNVFVTTEFPLQLGDTFTLGDTTILVQDPDAPDPPGMKEPVAKEPVAKEPVAKEPVAASRPAPPASPRLKTPAPAAPPPSPRPAAPRAPVRAHAGSAASGMEAPEGGKQTGSELPDRPEQLPNHVLAGYKIGPMLARGRTGFVFKAADTRTGKAAAIKVLPAVFASDERNLQQFARSMKLALPLRHANVVPVLGAGKYGSYCWVAMELVNGESLTATIRHIGVAGSLDWRRALRVSIHLARGMVAIHEQQIVFRNVGPQNIICEGDAKLPRWSDFLRCRPFFDPVEPGSGSELPDSLLLYAAPEQTREETEIDSRSDIFNFGALIYSLLTGRPPFEGGSLAETITKIRRERPEDPRKFQLAIPKALEGVVLQMLAKRPEDRYQTVAEVLRDLDRVLKYQGMTL